MSPKSRIIGFGSHGHVEKSENDELSGFPKVKSKSYESKMKQNTSSELLGHSINKIYSKSDPLDLPQTLNPDLF